MPEKWKTVGRYLAAIYFVITWRKQKNERKLFSARRWKDPPIYRVVKVGGSKEDKIKGINWGLKNGVLTKEEYDQRMKEIEEEFKNK